MVLNSELIRQAALEGLKNIKSVGSRITKAEDWLDDKVMGVFPTNIRKQVESPEMQKVIDTAMSFSPMGFVSPAMTGFRRAIPKISQSIITKEQIPIMKEIGLFNKPPSYQQEFVKTMGQEMRYIQNKAHIEGWDKARTTKAYKDMADRFTGEQISKGPSQVTAEDFLNTP